MALEIPKGFKQRLGTATIQCERCEYAVTYRALERSTCVTQEWVHECAAFPSSTLVRCRAVGLHEDGAMTGSCTKSHGHRGFCSWHGEVMSDEDFAAEAARRRGLSDRSDEEPDRIGSQPRPCFVCNKVQTVDEYNLCLDNMVSSGEYGDDQDGYICDGCAPEVREAVLRLREAKQPLLLSRESYEAWAGNMTPIVEPQFTVERFREAVEALKKNNLPRTHAVHPNDAARLGMLLQECGPGIESLSARPTPPAKPDNTVDVATLADLLAEDAP